MSNVLQYNGHVGSIEYSETDGVFFGEVLGIKSLISYEGNCAKELVEDFQEGQGLLQLAGRRNAPAWH